MTIDGTRAFRLSPELEHSSQVMLAAPNSDTLMEAGIICVTNVMLKVEAMDRRELSAFSDTVVNEAHMRQLSSLYTLVRNPFVLLAAYAYGTGNEASAETHALKLELLEAKKFEDDNYIGFNALNTVAVLSRFNRTMWQEKRQKSIVSRSLVLSRFCLHQTTARSRQDNR